MTATKTSITCSLQLIDDATGNVAGVWNDFVQLTAKKILNKGGMIVSAFPIGHPILDTLERDALYRVMIGFTSRAAINNDIPTTVSFSWFQDDEVALYGLYRDTQVVMDESGNLYHMLYMMHPDEILTRYVSGFPTGVAGKSVWSGTSPAVIANDLVRWNMTEEATAANGRIRDASRVRGANDMGAVGGLSSINFALEPGAPLGDTIRELAKSYGFIVEVKVANDGTLAVTQSPLTGGGATGEDRRDSVRFHLHLDNLQQASLGGDSLQERTVAIVGGGGEGGSRTFEVRTGQNYSSPENDYEMWVNGSSLDASELPALGDKALARVLAKGRYTSRVGVSVGYMPFRDFDIGDIVTSYVGEASRDQRVTSIELTFDQTQRPQTFIELEDYVE